MWPPGQSALTSQAANRPSSRRRRSTRTSVEAIPTRPRGGGEHLDVGVKLVECTLRGIARGAIAGAEHERRGSLGDAHRLEMRSLGQHQRVHVDAARTGDAAIPDEPALLELEDHLGQRQRIAGASADDARREVERSGRPSWHPRAEALEQVRLLGPEPVEHDADVGGEHVVGSTPRGRGDVESMSSNQSS